MSLKYQPTKPEKMSKSYSVKMLVFLHFSKKMSFPASWSRTTTTKHCWRMTRVDSPELLLSVGVEWKRIQRILAPTLQARGLQGRMPTTQQVDDKSPCILDKVLFSDPLRTFESLLWYMNIITVSTTTIK